MWVTQSAAIKEICDRTGIPEIEATHAVKGRAETKTTKAIKAMPTKRFGSRDMVHRLSVEEFIAVTNLPPVPVKREGNIRPFSAKTVAKIRTMGVPVKRRQGARI